MYIEIRNSNRAEHQKNVVITTVGYANKNPFDDVKFSLAQLSRCPSMTFLEIQDEGSDIDEMSLMLESEILFAVSNLDTTSAAQLSCQLAGQRSGDGGAVFVTRLSNRNTPQMAAIKEAFDHILYVEDKSIDLASVVRWLVCDFSVPTFMGCHTFEDAFEQLGKSKESVYSQIHYPDLRTAKRQFPSSLGSIYALPYDAESKTGCLLSVTAPKEMCMEYLEWAVETVSKKYADGAYVAAQQNETPSDKSWTINLLQFVVKKSNE